MTVTLFFTLVGYVIVPAPFVTVRQVSLKRPRSGVSRFENEAPASQPTLLPGVLPMNVVSSAYGTSFVSAGGTCEIVSVPARDDTSSVKRREKSNGCFVVRFSVPPIPWPSMSGVGVFCTCTPLSSSPPTTSSGTRRPPLSVSALPSDMPLIVTLLRRGLMPRIWTNRPSPFSSSIDTPGMRFNVSPMFLSGSRPISSALKASTTPSASRFTAIELA